MAASGQNSNLELIHSAVRKANQIVLSATAPKMPPSAGGAGSGAGARSDESGPDTDSPYDQAVAKAVQSIAQSTAIAIQDGVDMLRNVSTVEVTAIGTATAKWIANPTMVVYKEVISTSVETIQDAAKAYKDIGQAAFEVLQQFDGS